MIINVGTWCPVLSLAAGSAEAVCFSPRALAPPSCLPPTGAHLRIERQCHSLTRSLQCNKYFMVNIKLLIQCAGGSTTKT